jgi:hypothetical protein
LYGIYINSWVIIVSFAPGVIGSWAVLILAIRYKGFFTKNTLNKKSSRRRF